MPIKTNLEIFRGEDVTIPYDVDEDTSGWTCALIISDELGDSSPTLSVAGTVTNASAGYIDVALSRAQTAALSLPSYHWELVRTNAGSYTVLAYGTLTVRPRVGV